MGEPFPTLDELNNKLPYILDTPDDKGELKLIVTRPATGQRIIHQCVEISAEKGVHGDKWADECWLTLEDGRPDPRVQICIMNARSIEAIAGDIANWAPAGDNLFIDMNLGVDNLQPGQRLTLGASVLEITDEAHNACAKFAQRYGRDASKFVNLQLGREHRLRGIYARVVQDGTICVGDRFCKI